jgi:hypothetical protein
MNTAGASKSIRSTGAKKSSVAKMAWAPSPAEARFIRFVANSDSISWEDTIVAIRPKKLLYLDYVSNELCTPA